MKTLVKYRAACHFESDGIAVRQGDELLCLGPSQPGPRRPHHARLYRCVLYRDGSQDLFVDVYPGEAEEIVETSGQQSTRLDSDCIPNRSQVESIDLAAIMRMWETRLSFDSQ